MLYSIHDFLHYSSVRKQHKLANAYSVVMLYKYGGKRKTEEEMQRYVKKMQLSYWGIFLIYLGVWFFIWRMCVTHEAM